MKIAILSPFYPYRGGIASFSNSLYKELNKKNEVKAFSFSTLYPSFLFPGKTQFVKQTENNNNLNADRILNSINPFSYLSTAKAINRYNPDILIVAYWMPFIAPALGAVCRFVNKNIKKIALVHNAIPHEKSFLDVKFAKYFFKKCDGFITLSEPVKGDIRNFIPDSEILVSPHPIYDHYKERIDRAEACSQLNIEANKKNLLFFGLIREYKGLDLLIKAMDYLTSDYQLIIGGESYGDFKQYQDLIDSSPLKDNIKVFEDYIPDDKVSLFFSASDILVLPYRTATQSGVVAVAYQMELPMVSTNAGALGETIRNYNTGIVVDEISPEAIAQGIKNYFEQDNRAEYLKNIKSEKNRLSWASFATSLIDFTKQI